MVSGLEMLKRAMLQNKIIDTRQDISNKQRHTTNEKPNMCLNLFDKNNQYFDP